MDIEKRYLIDILRAFILQESVGRPACAGKSDAGKLNNGGTDVKAAGVEQTDVAKSCIGEDGDGIEDKESADAEKSCAGNAGIGEFCAEDAGAGKSGVGNKGNDPDYPAEAAGIDWRKLKYLSDIHSVTGIVGYMAKQYGLCTQEEGLSVLWSACKNSLFVFAQRAERMQALSRKMQDARIDHILFKGYVLKDYYPVPELRSYGDIDFVIRLEDRPRSHDLMLQNGYQVKSDWEAVFSYYKDIEYYEIHSDIMEIDVTDKADYRGFFRHMWEHTVRVDDYVWEFTPEFHFIYLLTHIAKHIYSSGAGLRMYLDLAAFILHFQNQADRKQTDRKQVDWERVRAELEEIKLYDFCCVALTAVEKWFGVKSPMELHAVPDEVMEAFFDFTMDGGVFGHVNRESGVNVLKQAGDEGKSASRLSLVSRLKVILKRLFPPAAEIESRYTYLQHRHWLLPMAWVHRIIKTRGEIGQHTHEANVILSADSDEVRRLKKLSEAIGL